MKIGIQTWGSQGDIRPFIALAGGLSAAGHQVTLAVTTDKNYDEFSKALNFEVRHIGNFNQITNYGQTYRAMLATRDFVKQFKLVFTTMFEPFAEQMYAAATDLCRDNDLVIGHCILYPLGIAAEKYDCPHITVYLAGATLSSSYMPPIGVPNLGRFFNPWLWKLAAAVADRVFLSPTNRLRRQEGLAPLKQVIGQPIIQSPLLNLVAQSPALWPPPPDWQGRHQVCGFLNVPGQSEPWQMPDDLANFLRYGPPPVYITFGSMTLIDNSLSQTNELLVEAVRKAGCRAIIQSEWDQVPVKNDNSTIYRIQSASHQHIFPSCALVVHHGGAGTTQTATLAGCPSVVVEHFLDQLYWGHCLRRAKVCQQVLHRRSLTAAKLARAIRQSLTCDQLKARSQRIAEGMAKENGVKQAVALIEQIAIDIFRPANNAAKNKF